MDYPTVKQVQEAGRVTLAKWYRFLPSPTNNDQVEAMNLIVRRHGEFGGWTSQLSKAVGFKQ